MTAKFPLCVRFEVHPALTEALTMAENVRTIIKDDAAVAGLLISRGLILDDCSFTPPKSQLSEGADRALVVLLADNQLVAHASICMSNAIT